MNHRSSHNMAQYRGSSSNNNNNYNNAGRDKRAEEANRLLLEEENEARLLELGEHVSLLKSVSDINC